MADKNKHHSLALKIGLTNKDEIRRFSELIDLENSASEALCIVIRNRFSEEELTNGQK